MTRSTHRVWPHDEHPDFPADGILTIGPTARRGYVRHAPPDPFVSDPLRFGMPVAASADDDEREYRDGEIRESDPDVLDVD